ncbi:uncharacterized protein [Lolium perenne]|uniref:uncharacterized protein n=1 Tax=Lolium perenne TaxID=4522 RepID=UPI0021EB1404|nr:uncharacterized protein LOC127298844 [Lolium perenne]
MAGVEAKPADATDEDAAAARDDDPQPQVARLPEDVLAHVLRRVPPRWLAASRCVCPAWRDAVDSRGLLLTDLLPLSFAGLFIHFNEHKFPEFFARPSSSSSSARAVSGDLSFLPSASPDCGHWWDEADDFRDYRIQDHCNGLLLLSSNTVVNPATRRWNALTTCPAKEAADDGRYHGLLAYNPMVSPDEYQVVMIPALFYCPEAGEVDPWIEESEWPRKIYVFSSNTGCWEARHFVREGDAAGIVGDDGMMHVAYWDYSAVYLRGALYVRCKADFLMRISLSTNTYSVIKPPAGIAEKEYYTHVQVVRSEKGVYLVELDKHYDDKCCLRVWILDESCGHMKWILKHDKDLNPLLGHRVYRRAHWTLEDINYKLFLSSGFQEEKKKATSEEKFEWNSDRDEYENMVDHCHLEDKKKSVVGKELEWNSSTHNVFMDEDMVEQCYLGEEYYDNIYHEDIKILGFHPYKEVVFLSASERTGLAYHLNGSKIEILGNIYPQDYTHFKSIPNELEKIKSFPYTPCWIEEFPGNN